MKICSFLIFFSLMFFVFSAQAETIIVELEKGSNVWSLWKQYQYKDQMPWKQFKAEVAKLQKISNTERSFRRLRPGKLELPVPTVVAIDERLEAMKIELAQAQEKNNQLEKLIAEKNTQLEALTNQVEKLQSDLVIEKSTVVKKSESGAEAASIKWIWLLLALALLLVLIVLWLSFRPKKIRTQGVTSVEKGVFLETEQEQYFDEINRLNLIIKKYLYLWQAPPDLGAELGHDEFYFPIRGYIKKGSETITLVSLPGLKQNIAVDEIEEMIRRKEHIKNILSKDLEDVQI